MLPPRAYVFLGLNGIRFLSIVSMLLVFSSNIVLLVDDVEAFNEASATGSASNSTSSMCYEYIGNSTVPNQPAGIFWAVLNRLLIVGQVVVLTLSELGWPAAFFDRYFSVLGKDFGVGALGVIQCLIGATVLSQSISTFALVSAFFLFVMGCTNILVGLIFREKSKTKRSILTWREKPKIPSRVAGVDTGRVVDAVSSVLGSHVNGPESQPTMRTFGWGRQAEKAAAEKGFAIQKPDAAL